jgi:diketogulonate reductase-like aldo/keto reductase
MNRPPLNEIFKCKDNKSKDNAMYEAHLQYGYTLKDTAEYIGVHYTTVSRAIKKSKGNMKSDIARLRELFLLMDLRNMYDQKILV